MLSLKELSRLTISELGVHGYELVTTYPPKGPRVTTIRKKVTNITMATLEKPRVQKSWKKVLEESMNLNTRSSDLQILSSGFLYRILPSRIRSELGKVMHELDFFKEYSNVLNLLNTLNQTGSLSGLEFANYTAGKKYSLDDRAKHISEQIRQLMIEIKNSKDYPQ